MSGTDPKTINRIKLVSGFVVSILVGVMLFVLLPEFMPYKLHICGISMMVLCTLTCLMWSEKNKTIASFTAIVPVIPMDLIYLGQLSLDDPIGLLVRAIPLVGNGYSLYRIFISKTLAPSEGWSSNLF